MLRVFLILFFMIFSVSIHGNKELNRTSQFNIKLSSYQLNLKTGNFKEKVSKLPNLKAHVDLCDESQRDSMEEEEFKKKRQELFKDLKKLKESYMKEMDAFSHHFLKNLNHFIKNLNHSLDLSSLKSEDLRKKAPELEKKIKELFRQDSYFSTSYNHLFYEYENYFKVLMVYLMRNIGFYYEDNEDILSQMMAHYQFDQYFNQSEFNQSDGFKAYCLNDAVFNFSEAVAYKNDSSILSMQLYYETLYLEILGMDKLTDHFLKQSLNCVKSSCVWVENSKTSSQSDNAGLKEGFFLRLAYNLKQLAMGLSKISKNKNVIQDDLQEDILKHIYTVESSLNANSLQFLERLFKITRIIFSKHIDDAFQENCKYSFLLDGESAGDVCHFH